MADSFKPDSFKPDAAPQKPVPGMERIGGDPPSAPRPPMPEGLAPKKPVSVPMRNRDGVITPKGLDVPMGPTATAATFPLRMMAGGAEQLGRGTTRVVNPKSADDFAGGVSDIVRGGGTLALPAAIPAIWAAPVRAGLAVGMGSAGGGAAEGLATAAGVPEGTSELLGTFAGGAAGHYGPLGVGATASKLAKPVAKSALNLPGRTERYGATPAEALLEETSGFRPAKIRESANARLEQLNRDLESLAAASGSPADLTSARAVIADAIAKAKAANGMPDDLAPMATQLTEARPGFGGAVTPSGEVAAQQSPSDFLRMKRQFGDDFTKFDAAVPLRDSARKVGNQAYHEMAAEFDRAVPGAAPINQRMQSLIPVRDAAQRTTERAGPVQRSVDRVTRPTGGLVAPLAGGAAGGPLGAAAVLAGQEAVASPVVRMAAARALHGGGKRASAPMPPIVSAGMGALSSGLLSPGRRRSTPPLLRPR